MMTTFILAPDSFKESMTAEQACAAMQRGIQNIIPDAVCILYPWPMAAKAQSMLY